jgi:peptide/nickel transport system ATP-binding protein
MKTANEDQTLLRVDGLRTHFRVEGREARAVDDVSFEIQRSEVLGLVGESGCGKSVTALSILRLIPEPPGRIAAGRILFDGRDLLSLSWPEVRAVRGRDIAMIFQEPMTSLNPVRTIGDQVAEPLRIHRGLGRKAARSGAADALTRVGIPDAARRLDDYPHQFSGGMRQRVMIAMALICEPALLIADEPTTALDVTIQAQILDLMREVQARREGGSILLITHDLAVIAETCDRVIVMYAGKIQEVATTRDLFAAPLHPYTRGLLASIPDPARKGTRLDAIPGNVPGIFERPGGCAYAGRCALATERCRIEEPELREITPGHDVRCHFPGETP